MFYACAIVRICYHNCPCRQCKGKCARASLDAAYVRCNILTSYYSPCDPKARSAQTLLSTGKSIHVQCPSRSIVSSTRPNIGRQHAARKKALSCLQAELKKLPAPGDAKRAAKPLRLQWTKSDRRRSRRSDAADRFAAAHSAPPGLARRRSAQTQRDCHRGAASAQR